MSQRKLFEMGANATERMRIDSGNLGIGTSPGTSLHLNGPRILLLTSALKI